MADEDHLKAEVRRLQEEVSLLREELAFVRTHLSSYLGNGIALTYLVDETPIYINADDFGAPANFINGGRYEEDNLAVLQRFVRDDTVFLDIGANLGIYAIQVGRRVHGFGKVHAFEPHPLLQNLLWRNTYLNGLRDTVQVHRFGLSDANATLQFKYPSGHLGGGAAQSSSPSSEIVVSSPIASFLRRFGRSGRKTMLQFEDREGRADGDPVQRRDNATLISAAVRRLDDVFDSEFSCDLMKIDVEGHELQVLRGMQRIIGNSPRLKILFENLTDASGTKNDIEAVLTQSRFSLYAVGPNASLQPLGAGELARFHGYVIAAPHGAAAEMTSGIRFSIYPRQLFHASNTLSELSQNRLVASGGSGQLLFHGPYWFLARGVWRLRVHGHLWNNFAMTIATRFGHKVAEFELGPGNPEAVFTSAHDLVHFECVGRGLGENSRVSIERIELIREG